MQTGYTWETVVIHEEKYLYSFLDVFSAIGGSLGIFLGWSIFQVYKSLSAKCMGKLESLN